MDNDIVSAKLESLRRCVGRVRERTPASVESLQGDHDAQDILCLNLERAVQVCVDIAAHIVADGAAIVPDTMAGGFDALYGQGIISETLAGRMRRAVGFRNISVHAYQTLDWAVVYAIATERLEDFLEFARAIEKLLEAGARGNSARP